MSIFLRCPTCFSQYEIKDELAGRKARCKKCGESVQIPAAAKPPHVREGASPATKSMAIGGTGTRVMPHAIKTADRLPHSPASVGPATIPISVGILSELDNLPPPSVPAKRAETPKVQAPPGRMQCPHCGMWVSSELSICSTCRLDMRKRFEKKANERDEEMRSNVKFSLIGIGATLVTAPLFFVLVAMVMGGGLALLLSVLIMQIGVSLGSFTLACYLFKQDAPEPGEILRIICYSNIPANVLASMLFGGGILGAVGSTAIAMVAAALVCMFHVGMPVVSSILISVVYNIFAGILTVVWAVVLGVVFAGYLVATQPNMLRQHPSQFEVPASSEPGTTIPESSEEATIPEASEDGKPSARLPCKIGGCWAFCP